MSCNVPDEIRASFLHSEGDDEASEEKIFRDPEENPTIPEDTPDESDKSVELNDGTADSSTCHESRLDIRRTSSDGFVALCKSFRTTSPHEMAASAASGVKEQFRDRLSESLSKDYDNRDLIAPFNTKEIVLGRKLGSGEFSHVYQVKSFRLESSSLEAAVSKEESEMRKYMKGREKYRDTNKSSYALKHLRPELLDKYEANEYAQFAIDLVQEAEFLSVLQHPNIIKLRGTSLDGFMGFEQGPKGYFLIIDRLDETLVDRLAKWKKSNGKGSFLNPTKKKDNGDEGKSLLSQQLEVVLQIAAAMFYLHEKNIIFRDLKPANVGFDVRGDVKLFDFGLAKMMPSNGDPYNDPFDMSGAGSPRYMAPEVLSSQPTYNLKADVYTFSIVLWEVLSLERPYAFVRNMNMLVDHVLREGGRPDIRDGWPSSIKDVLQMSFDSSPDERPSLKFVFESIRFELRELRNGDDSKLRNSYLLRRRSLASTKELNTGRKQNKARDIRSQLGKTMTKIGRQFSM